MRAMDGLLWARSIVERGAILLCDLAGLVGERRDGGDRRGGPVDSPSDRTQDRRRDAHEEDDHAHPPPEAPRRRGASPVRSSRRRRRPAGAVAILAFLAGVPALAGAAGADYPIRPVPFTAVDDRRTASGRRGSRRTAR